jgi:hypothetical protein
MDGGVWDGSVLREEILRGNSSSMKSSDLNPLTSASRLVFVQYRLLSLADAGFCYGVCTAVCRVMWRVAGVQVLVCLGMFIYNSPRVRLCALGLPRLRSCGLILLLPPLARSFPHSCQHSQTYYTSPQHKRAIPLAVSESVYVCVLGFFVPYLLRLRTRLGTPPCNEVSSRFTWMESLVCSRGVLLLFHCS